MLTSRRIKAQVALEFIIMIGLSIMIGSVLLLVTSTTFSEASEQQRAALLNDIGYSIQDEVILATNVEDGYERTFTIPESAGRFSYEISSTPVSIKLTSGATKISYSIPDVLGGFTKGSNTISKNGDITVTQP